VFAALVTLSYMPLKRKILLHKLLPFLKISSEKLPFLYIRQLSICVNSTCHLRHMLNHMKLAFLQAYPLLRMLNRKLPAFPQAYLLLRSLCRMLYRFHSTQINLKDSYV
jgi:hypothetical protein